MERKILSNRFSIDNESVSGKSCFHHVSVLRGPKGEELHTYKATYYNRTWEAYPFQTSMRRCLKQYIESAPPYLATELTAVLDTL